MHDQFQMKQRTRISETYAQWALKLTVERAKEHIVTGVIVRK